MHLHKKLVFSKLADVYKAFNLSYENQQSQKYGIMLYFGTKIKRARVKLISMMILALCKIKSINYMSLAKAFDNSASPESLMRRIQQFMANFDLSMKLVSRFIFGILPQKENLILVMDRTNRKFGNSNINILMLEVCYKNKAIPLIFKMLDKRGNSNSAERIDLVSKFIE